MNFSRLVALPASLLLAAAIPGPCSFNSYPELDCADDGVCPEGLTCGADGFCKTAGVAGNAGPPPDTNPVDPGDPDDCGACPPGTVCEADTGAGCVPVCSLITCEPPTECDPELGVPNCDRERCVGDGECRLDELCEGGSCVTGCVEGRNCFAPDSCIGGFGGQCREDTTDQGCINDVECGQNELCEGDVCVPGCEFGRNCFGADVCEADVCVTPPPTSSCDPLQGTGCVGGDACNVVFPNGLDAPEGRCAPAGSAPPFEVCLPNVDVNPCAAGSFCLPLGSSSGICLPFCQGALSCGVPEHACVVVAPGTGIRACTPRCTGGLGECPQDFGICDADPTAGPEGCGPANQVCLLGGCNSESCPEQCEVVDGCGVQSCSPVTTPAPCGGVVSSVCL